MSQSEERDNLSVMDAGSRLRLMSGTVLKKPRWERQKSIKKRDVRAKSIKFFKFSSFAYEINGLLELEKT
ncbi:MAG: hypothetical protein E6G74_22360 [Alphaproteobacteria bacterium]|nr:MAG: hypothetical protein E6G74_22360 [Alphaproteobacteria bacterium]